MPPISAATHPITVFNDIARAERYAAAARSPNTLRAYRADLQDFKRYCKQRQVPSLPAQPATIATYLAHLADQGRKAATLERRLAAISQAHQHAGYQSPTGHAAVRTVFKGIRRTHGIAAAGKAPIMVEDLRAMVAALPASLHGVRDRALLLLGFAGGFRRSELVGIVLADLEFVRDGVVVTLRRSKTDQEGQGRRVAIPYGSSPQTCPVRALTDWLTAAKSEDGPIFRAITRRGFIRYPLKPQYVSFVVKHAAEAAGLDHRHFSGHSLRAGLCTAAARAGVSKRAIMNQTGHRSSATLRRYIREGNLFTDNAAALIGL